MTSIIAPAKSSILDLLVRSLRTLADTDTPADWILANANEGRATRGMQILKGQPVASAEAGGGPSRREDILAAAGGPTRSHRDV